MRAIRIQQLSDYLLADQRHAYGIFAAREHLEVGMFLIGYLSLIYKL
jgi:hypothetical protein